MTDRKFTFRVEMLHGQDQREVNADGFTQRDGGLIFNRANPQGGQVEYWRAKMDCVVGLETRINP